MSASNIRPHSAAAKRLQAIHDKVGVATEAEIAEALGVSTESGASTVSVHVDLNNADDAAREYALTQTA